MATRKMFNGILVKEPGVYTRIISGVINKPVSLDYGKIMLIDNGIGVGFGGGAGIVPEKTTPDKTIYRDLTFEEFRELVKGGVLWDVAKNLFKPSGDEPGASSISFVRSAATEAAVMDWTFTGGGAAGGTISCYVKDEGTIGNGVLNADDELSKGHGSLIGLGIEASHFVLSFWRGTYKGKDSNNVEYESTDLLSEPELICVSSEFNTLDELVLWMQTDKTFNTYYGYIAHNKVGTGVIDGGDQETYAEYNLAAGGTETYSTGSLDKVFKQISEDDYSILLADESGSDADESDYVAAMLAHIEDHKTKYNKMMIVGGYGADVADVIADSVGMAETYDSEQVVIVHGAELENDLKDRNAPTGYISRPSLYLAARVAGRLAGLPPQVPITQKTLKIDGLVVALSPDDREAALDGGVTHVKWDSDFRAFIVNQGVNSIQDNEEVVNRNGKTHSIQLFRIMAQLNKDIYINAKLSILGNPKGVNRNVLTERDFIDWTEGFLQTKLATKDRDDIIVAFKNINCVRDGDIYNLTYEFAPNIEINKFFITGVMIDV